MAEQAGYKQAGTGTNDRAVARALVQAVAGLDQMRPGPGLAKTGILAGGLIVCIAGVLLVNQPLLWFALLITGGLLAASALILTHDAIHHTLTGIVWFDEGFSRLFGYIVLWPHGVYAEVHKLHHAFNGKDLRDPERVQWTQAEYDQASRLGQWYARNQWLVNIFVLGGVGLIGKTMWHAWKLRDKGQAVKRALITETAGIVLTNLVWYAALASVGLGWRWLLVWFLWERIIGAILQWRAHVEHYGLWGRHGDAIRTQAYNCRNVRTARWWSWYLNGLNYHSVHHAFPKIPFYNLREAHLKMQAALADVGAPPLPEVQSYPGISQQLARKPRFIKET